MRVRAYAWVGSCSLGAGVLALVLRGAAPFSPLAYFTEMYPFFFGLAFLVSLIVSLCRVRGVSSGARAMYWCAITCGCLGIVFLVGLGLFANPINWKNYTDFTPVDRIWMLVSNTGIVCIGVVVAVALIKELRRIRQTK